jgi:hypothetical protein
MKQSIAHIRFIFTAEGKLLPQSGKEDLRFREFKEKLEKDQTVEVFMEANEDNGTLPQLAKIHACIRKLAEENGDTFEDMKLYVKKKAGLCIRKEIDNEIFMVCKSLSVCSKEELGLVIEAIYEIGDQLKINLR